MHVQRLQREQRRSEIRSHAVSQKDTNLLARLVERQSVRGVAGAGARHWRARARLRRRRCRRRRRAVASTLHTTSTLQLCELTLPTFDAICTFPTILNCVTHTLNYLFDATESRLTVKLESSEVLP